MNRYNTEGIILSRTNFGEADRILTFLTPDHGKVQAIAKGVRKQKSKLAGGLEIFSISRLSLLVGKSEINTIISTKLKKHYANIVVELERTDAAYEMIKLIAKSTAEHPERAYFDLLASGFEAMDNRELDWRLGKLWFDLHLLKLSGHSPNFKTNSAGKPLKAGISYNFDTGSMCFVLAKNGQGSHSANHIKLFRLAAAASSPKLLAKINGSTELANDCCGLTQTLLAHYSLYR